MTLPGTARGQGGSGDGNADAMMPIYRSIPPTTNFNSKTTTYRKTHRMMTFGLAHVGLQGNVTGTPTETQRWITTYLASIPWHKPYYYMSPGEYAILGPNAKVKSVRITVVHRGNRIAFQTASSTTQLATLNNIQNIAVAYGLNKTGFGVDMLPSFAAEAPMVPNALTYNESNQNYINSWYGFPQNVALATWKSEMPDVFLGFKSVCRNYFNLASNANNTMGDPMLAKHLMMMDGKTTINQVVGEFEYHPKMAPLKQESQYIRYGLPTVNDSQSTINIEGNLHNQHTLTLDLNNSTPTAQYVQGDQMQRTLNNSNINTDLPTNGIFPTGSYYMRDIEKSNFMKKGVWGDAGDKSSIQPSVHVGIQAIPALSTDVIGTSGTSNFTDAQADWEIVAEMVVDEGIGVDFAWSQQGNKAFHDVTMVSTEPTTNSCVIGGRHTTNAIRPANTYT